MPISIEITSGCSRAGRIFRDCRQLGKLADVLDTDPIEFFASAPDHKKSAPQAQPLRATKRFPTLALIHGKLIDKAPCQNLHSPQKLPTLPPRLTR